MIVMISFGRFRKEPLGETWDAERLKLEGMGCDTSQIPGLRIFSLG